MRTSRPWFAIIWFALWGIFQAYAVFSVMNGSWKRPAAFPKEAYTSLIYPDLFFIPAYLLTSFLLFRGHRMGNILGFITGGGVIYAMIYLFALSGLKGVENLIFDGLFLCVNTIAMIQLVKMRLAER